MKLAEAKIDQLISDEQLPTHYKDLVGDYLWPLIQDMAAIYKQRDQSTPWLIGLQGTQGSGKSTVCLFIKALLETCFNFNVVVLSIDDFYKTQLQRKQLSKDVHPLFITRGVPGTHDIPLALNTIESLSSLKEDESYKLPTFNKALDEREDESKWRSITGKVDIILLEGWCIGIPSQRSSLLNKPINELEKNEDENGIWRTAVNQSLSSQYNEFYKKIENLIVLQAPSFKCVYQWRLLQEKKLADKTQLNGHSKIQTPEQIERFIAHYERLTRHALNVLPDLASWVISLNEHHDMTKLIRNNSLVRVI